MLLTILVAAFAADPVKPAEPAARMSIVTKGNATIFGMAVLLGANEAGWSPSKVEAAMTSARKVADPAKAPEECPMVPGAGEQLRKRGL